MTIDRVEQGKTVGTVSITTQEDGSIRIASTGRMPGGSLGELRQAREGLQLFTQMTQQDTTIEHNGQQLARITAHPTKVPRWSVRWLAVLRLGIERLSRRDGA